MSKIIEVSKTVIKHPAMLQKAVEYLNDFKKYGVVEAQFTQDASGKITGGYIHLQTPDTTYGRGHIFLKFQGTGKPEYSEDGIIQNGHFSLMGDGDFQSNKNFATLISDHYNAQVVKNLFESQGQPVEFQVADDGAITVETCEPEGLAACGY